MRTRFLYMTMASVIALAAVPFAAQAGDAEKTRMPASEHQEDVLRGEVESKAPESAPGEIPATEHQRDVLGLEQAEKPVSAMPASPHQEDVLGDIEAEIPDPSKATSQSVGEEPYPATEHQEDVLDIED